MDAREADRRLGVEPLVEDCGEHRRERRSQACRACGADRELEAVRVEDERRCHAALEVVARLRIARRDVRLAEEVVQLGVEARHPDPCAHPEGVREHARAAMRVHGDHVRGVLSADRLSLERVHESQHAFRRRHPADTWEPRKQLREPPTDRRVSPRVDLGTRRSAARAKPGGTKRGLPRRARRRPPGAAPRRSSLGRQSLAPSSASASRVCRRPGWSRSSPARSVRPSRVKISAPRSSAKSSPSISSVRSCISGSGTPRRASSRAGSQSRCHGSRPNLPASSPSAAGRPGTAHDGAPIAYTTSSSPNAIGSSASSAEADGTAANPSRFRTLVPSNTMA